jgi:predicted RNA-binding Zn-ribbon protein involved in translation (DUF1610 family)
MEMKEVADNWGMVCPSCGKEHRVRNFSRWLKYGSALLCPDCLTTLGREEVWEGFFEWLEKVKREDPKRYAQIVAELL